MFKTGIYDVVKLKNIKNIFGGSRKVSITLYNELNNSEVNDIHCEQILSLFSNEKGAYKKTYTNRFKLIDKELINLISKKFALNSEPILIHDTSVSDGRTSYDFYNLLEKNLKKIVFYASDYETYYLCFRYKKLIITTSKNLKLLEILARPFVLNLIKNDNPFFYPFNNFLALFLKLYFLFFIKRKIIDKKISFEKIYLINHKLKSLIKKPNFFLIEHDLLKKFDKYCHIIRSFNVFVPSYFSNDDIDRIIFHIFNSLYDDGIFIVGYNKSSDSDFNGNIFSKKSNHFISIKKFGIGTHFLDNILSFREKS